MSNGDALMPEEADSPTRVLFLLATLEGGGAERVVEHRQVVAERLREERGRALHRSEPHARRRHDFAPFHCSARSAALLTSHGHSIPFTARLAPRRRSARTISRTISLLGSQRGAAHLARPLAAFHRSARSEAALSSHCHPLLAVSRNGFFSHGDRDAVNGRMGRARILRRSRRPSWPRCCSS